jgi:membrane protein implicated in regulation of membrane protease activity
MNRENDLQTSHATTNAHAHVAPHDEPIAFAALAYLSLYGAIVLVMLASRLRVLFFRYVLERAERREERMHLRKAQRLPERLRKRYLRSVGL